LKGIVVCRRRIVPYGGSAIQVVLIERCRLVLVGEVGRIGFQGWLRGSSKVLVIVVEIGHQPPLFGRVGVGVLDTHLVLLVT
jgi:hypothetical protein